MGGGPGTLRLDVLTIFPDYLRVLDLSLIGRAAQDGLIDVSVHDLRDWTHDRHRTVDDTPLGGGAGMVMKPDVWGEALDEVLALSAEPDARGRTALLIPSPSGEVFTQRTAEDLARADHLVIACGRYEGIDGRVAEHYRSAGLEVRELSIGDYVLNGGEAAALVIIEAVARLRPGVLGNPESVVEESHSSAGLLEYTVHTRPVAWRGQDLAVTWPALLSGDHARIARQRRDQAIARTAQRRPDMIARLRPRDLDAGDRAALARNGWAVPEGAPAPVGLVVRPADPDDVPALAELAARTFPDACPPFLTASQIADHVARHLTVERISAWVEDPRVVVTIAEVPDGVPGLPEPLEPGALVGYSVVIAAVPGADGALPAGLDELPGALSEPATPAEPPAVAAPPAVAELSKCYVDRRLRSSGVARVLVEEAVCDAGTMGAGLLWLGTHEGNRRAQKAYRRAGFRAVGTRRYVVGGAPCRDVVMAINPQEVAHDGPPA